MKIWIDADACPTEIKEIIIKAAYRRCINAIFVSNKNMNIPESQYISFVKVDNGPDIADMYIADKAESKDIIITQDIPLASLVVSKGAIAISFHGELFTSSNVGERLSLRNFMQELRDSGIDTKGPNPFNNKHKQQFANTFDQQIVKLSKHYLR